MKLLERCILLSCISASPSVVTIAAASNVNRKAMTNTSGASASATGESSQSSSSSSSSLSSSSLISTSSHSSSIEVPFVKEQSLDLNDHDHDHDTQLQQHEQHSHQKNEHQSTHAQSNSQSQSHSQSYQNTNIHNNSSSSNNNNRRNLRQFESYLNLVNLQDGVYEFYNEFTAAQDFVDTEVVMAANGRRIAIRGKNPNGNPESFYALYNINTLNAVDEWVYEKVSGTTTSVLSGTSISISSDSNEVAVGTNSCDSNVDIPGTMCVYIGESDNNSNAPEKGPLEERYIDDNTIVDSWGIGVSLSGQGVYAVVGSSHGMVYVYNVPTMLMLTGPLSLSKHGDPVIVDQSVINAQGTTTFGEIVKMAGEESVKTFVVGGENCGRIAVFKYNENSRQWGKVGGDISADGDEFAISDNGTIVAVTYRETEVRIFELITTSTIQYWSKLGDIITVPSIKNPSISMSANGKIIAVGAYKRTYNSASKPGYVQLYEYSSNKWEEMAVPLVDPGGYSSRVAFGRSVSLSGDGMRLAVAAPAHDGAWPKKEGYVRVFDLSDPFPSAAPSGHPTAAPSSISPTRSPAPSNDPATEPSASPTSKPSTSRPTINPSAGPSSSFRPSMKPSVSNSPTKLETDSPSSSICVSNCDCGTAGANPFCTLSLCRFNCNCDEGGCDLSLCEYDCRCKGGNCNMNRCESNCQCQGRNCQMDNCIYNGSCNTGVGSGAGSSVGLHSGRDRAVLLGLIFAGLVAVGAF